MWFTLLKKGLAPRVQSLVAVLTFLEKCPLDTMSPLYLNLIVWDLHTENSRYSLQTKSDYFSCYGSYSLLPLQMWSVCGGPIKFSIPKYDFSVERMWDLLGFIEDVVTELSNAPAFCGVLTTSSVIDLDQYWLRPVPMLTYFLLDPWRQILVKFYKNSRKLFN